MNKDALDKIINRFIMPQYPWIERFKTTVEYNHPNQFFMVWYYVSPDWMKEFDNKEKLRQMEDVQDMTKMAYQALGYDKNQRLDKIEFYVSKEDYVL